MRCEEKIKALSELAEAVDAARVQAKTIVHCHGVFDLLHIGHIRYLQKSKELGDLLIVTVTPDRFVNKGPHRPAFQELLRAHALAALDCVDYVAINDRPTAAEVIELLRPNVYAKGAEFRDRKTPELEGEESAAAAVGARVEYVEDITSSSSQLINNYLHLFSAEVERYLTQLKQEHSADGILDFLQRARSLKVLVVGEAIIDEYYACQVIGKSSKAPIVAARYESHERFAGGALAVANHLSTFCQQVDLITMLGAENSEEEWIRTQLHGSVRPTFLKKANSPTIVKRRYHESYYSVPLFEICHLNVEPLTESDDAAVTDALRNVVADYDVVIAADYGHAMLGDNAREELCREARFLAVNTQANAANVGFHTIAKYDRADFVSLAELELQLECRSYRGDHRSMLREVADRLNLNTIIVTLGKKGCLCYNRRSGYCGAPALTTNVVDRVGVNDAFLAITSICAALDLPVNVTTFLGNVAGAQAVETLGHSQYLDQLSLRRHVQSLLK